MPEVDRYHRGVWARHGRHPAHDARPPPKGTTAQPWATHAREHERELASLRGCTTASGASSAGRCAAHEVG